MATARDHALSAGRSRPLDLEQRVKLRLSWLRRLYVFLWVELRSPVRVPWRTRFKAWRHGFLTTSWFLYELEHKDPGEYLQDHRFRDYALFDRHRLAIMDKLGLCRTLAGLGVPQAQPIAFVQEGTLLPLDIAVLPAGEPMDYADLTTDWPAVVFRPVGGWAGRGVFFVHRDGERFLVDRQPTSLDELRSRIASLDQYMVTEYLECADYAAAVSPGRPNTLRLLTLWDLDTGRPFIAVASQRFSGSPHTLVDAFKSAGDGLTAKVDLETGVLGPGLNIDRRGRHLSHDLSPFSGAPITGAVVPHWQETKSRLLDLAAALPQYPLVGWDVLMTNDGPFWIEGNSPPGIQLWQAHTPLLRDPRSRAFFEWMGAA